MNAVLCAAPAVAATLSALAVWLLARRASALPPDVPNARSLHARPVPRAGGYAIWAGFIPAALLAALPSPVEWQVWLPGWAALVVVSAIDDVREVRVLPRLAVHAAAALWAAAWLVLQQPLAHDAGALLSTAAIALVIAWSANLYNFMDGTDGLAATMGAIGFAAYALGTLADAPGASTTAAATATFVSATAAIIPFLAVNRPRASMFLGDVGAVPLGFLAAVFGVGGVGGGWWPAWFPLLVFLPFIADATLTLARRMARRERLWEGHRSHFYQRLHQLGAGHGGTLGVYGAAMLGTAATAVYCRFRAPAAGWWALAAWIAVVLMLFATIDYHWRKKINVSTPIPQ